MSYIEKNLLPNERVLYRAHLHWIVFLWPAILVVLALQMFSAGPDGATVGMAMLFVAAIAGLVAFIAYTTSEFGITNKRVIAKVGFIRRNSIEVLLSKVEGIHVKQGILGRMLGYGSIVVSGTGGMKDPFHKISAPLEFRQRAQQQIEAVQRPA